MKKEGNDGSLDLADINFEPAPPGFAPDIVVPEGNINDRDVDANG